LENINKKLKEK